jgi:hypothetical protein
MDMGRYKVGCDITSVTKLTIIYIYIYIYSDNTTSSNITSTVYHDDMQMLDLNVGLFFVFL